MSQTSLLASQLFERYKVVWHKAAVLVGHNRFQGRDKIKEFYEWRDHHCSTMGSSVKTTRHLISNLFIGSSDGRSAKVLGIVSFYGAAGRPTVTKSKPPLLMADLINECALDENSSSSRVWRCRECARKVIGLHGVIPQHQIN
jgi:hypothetical protein